MNDYPNHNNDITENNINPDFSDDSLVMQQNGVLRAVRQWAGSKIFLISAIALIVVAVLAFASPFVDGIINNAVSDTPVTVADIAWGAVIMLPCVLMAVGMWMTYSSANGESEGMSTKGLKLMRASLIIALAFIVIIVAVLICWLPSLYATQEIFSPLFSHEYGEYPAVDGWAFLAQLIGALAVLVIIIMVVVVIILIALFVAAFIGAIRAIRTIKVIKSAAETGVVTGKISVFAAVMSIIFGAFSIYSSLTMFSQGLYVMGAAFIAFSVALVLFGVNLFICRSRISKAVKAQEN